MSPNADVDDIVSYLSCSCVQVAGSAAGISAFQMDIKVEGITLDIMKQVRQHSLAARHLKHACYFLACSCGTCTLRSHKQAILLGVGWINHHGRVTAAQSASRVVWTDGASMCMLA